MELNADFSSCMAHNCFDYLNICGPLNSGKTTYLNALREYHTENNESDTCSDHAYDRHFIIYLDFSDFAAIAYIDAISFFRKKMSELYQDMYEDVKEELRHYITLGYYLDVIEGKVDKEKLKKSLVEMVRFVGCGQRNEHYYNRPLILIDEVTRPLLYAAKYGYLEEMRDFYDGFLDIDHYEMTSGIITTSFAPANTDVHFDLKYIKDVPVNQYEPMKSICKSNGIELVEPHVEGDYSNNHRYFDAFVTFEQCFDKLISEKSFLEPPLSQYEIELSPEMKSFVVEKWIHVMVEKSEYEKSEKKRREREKLELAQPLAAGIPIPSSFAGIRELDFCIGKCDEYDRLNTLIRELYDRYGNEAYSQDVYCYIQRIGDYYKNVSEIRSAIVTLKDYADSKDHSYRCWIDVQNHDWAKFNLERFDNDNGYGDMALVKTYISVSKPLEVVHVFEDVLRFLIDNGTHRFKAKIAIRERKDHICLWLCREDFFLLEKYIVKYDEILESPLEFVPYRGKLGVTREFSSWLSYNGLLSELIEIYLKGIETRDEIDVIDMYSAYVKAWNGDLKEDNPFSEKYRESNAQELLVLLESLNVILGNAAVGDDSILLSGNGELWDALGQANSWYKVGVNIKGKLMAKRK